MPDREHRDRDGKWLLAHFGGAFLRLGGFMGFDSFRLAPSETLHPLERPDGLLEVMFPGKGEPELFLVELAAFPEERLNEQVMRDLAAIYLERGIVPNVLTIIMQPRGKLQIEGSKEIRSSFGKTELHCRWQVVEIWKLTSHELLEANDVGLLPWVPLSVITEEPEVLLRECRQRIDQWADPIERQNLLAIMSAITKTRFFGRGFEEIFGGDSMLSELPFMKEMRRMATAPERAAQSRRHTNVLLLNRFGEPAKLLEKRLDNIKNADLWEELFDRAVTCANLAEFEASLPAPKAEDAAAP